MQQERPGQHHHQHRQCVHRHRHPAGGRRDCRRDRRRLRYRLRRPNRLRCNCSRLGCPGNRFKIRLNERLERDRFQFLCFVGSAVQLQSGRFLGRRLRHRLQAVRPGQPLLQFGQVRVNAAPSTARHPAHWQSPGRLPAANRAHVLVEEGRDLFPGVQSLRRRPWIEASLCLRPQMSPNVPSRILPVYERAPSISACLSGSHAEIA